MGQLGKVLNGKKLNYDRLSRIIPEYIPKDTEEYDSVNIIIDLYDIFKQLYNPEVIQEIEHLKAIECREIAGEVINLISHYRHYFYSRCWKYTTFYFIYSDDIASYQTSIYPEYRCDFYKKRLQGKLNIDSLTEKGLPNYAFLNKVIKHNMNVIKLFIDHIPHAYLINSGNIDYTLLPHILLENNLIEREIPTILISNDDIFYQDFKEDNYLMQLLIKGDKSRIISYENMYADLTKDLKKQIDVPFSNDLHTVLLSIIGNVKYNIPKINGMGIGRGIPYLDKQLLTTGILNDVEYTSSSVFEEAINKSNIKDEHKQIITRNFKIISHASMDNLAYTQKDLYNIENQCHIEKVDSVYVKKSNDKYFGNYPILLDFCFEGETY